MYEQKVVDAPCSAGCGGKYILNPKTNKVFCENKCWLNPQQAQGTPQAAQNQPQSAPAANNDPKPNWDEIALGKVRHGVACAMIQSGKPLDKLEMSKWVDWIMNGDITTPKETNIPVPDNQPPVGEAPFPDNVH